MSQQGNPFAVAKTADVHVDRLGIPHDGAPIVVSWGAGVDSTTMLVAMRREGVIPDKILFADTGGEKPETYAYLDHIEPWLASWGAPSVTGVRKKPSPRASYSTLEGNCLGRRFAWNQFAVENGIVDVDGQFIGDRQRCLTMAAALRRDDNAPDRRGMPRACNEPFGQSLAVAAGQRAVCFSRVSSREKSTPVTDAPQRR